MISYFIIVIYIYIIFDDSDSGEVVTEEENLHVEQQKSGGDLYVI